MNLGLLLCVEQLKNLINNQTMPSIEAGELNGLSIGPWQVICSARPVNYQM